MTDLYAPVTLGHLSLKNRAVLAPMTRNRAAEDGLATPSIAAYYAQRAGAGLVITEGAHISAEAKGYPNTPAIHDPAHVEAWRPAVEAVHARGARIFLQIWHTGRVSHPLTRPGGAQPVAPSAIAPEGKVMTREGMKDPVVPRALDAGEIAAIVADFGRAASNAAEAGFDGVELHAANGYLIDQFLRDGSNQRADRYGGSADNRARFLAEVVEVTAAAIGPDRVGVRLSPLNRFTGIHDSRPQETFEHASRVLSEFGLAYLHMVEGGQGEVDFQALRQAFGGAYIANGGYDADRAQEALRSGRADLVSFATPFIANPDLIERFRAGAPLATADRATFYGGGDRGFIDYPAWAG